MSNLIPPQGRKSVVREYVTRVISVYAFLLVAVFVALCALSVPTYVLVSAQLDVNLPRNDAGKDVDTTYVEAETAIKKANELLAQLATPSPSIHSSEILGEIKKSAHDGIVFKTFQIQQSQEKSDVVITVSIQGVAGSRGALAALKETLEASPLFEHAEVPISDLARDAALPFVITLTVNGEALQKS